MFFFFFPLLSGEERIQNCAKAFRAFACKATDLMSLHETMLRLAGLVFPFGRLLGDFAHKFWYERRTLDHKNRVVVVLGVYVAT